MPLPETTARHVLGDLYRGHELVATRVDGVVVLSRGAPLFAALGGGDLGLRDARALVGVPLTLACYRGPLLSVEINRVQSLAGRPALHADCRRMTFGPPLEVLDEAELELHR